MKKILILTGVLALTVSCNSTKKGSSSDKVSTTISDSTLTSFEQTAGVALKKPSWLDKVIPNAYAIAGNINCFTGDPVSFDMDIKIGSVTEDLQVDTKCGANVELAIRRKMLQSLNNHEMMLEVVPGGMGGGDSLIYRIDFSAGDFEFDKPFPTLEEDLGGGDECWVDYTFKSNGKIVSNLMPTGETGRALEHNELVNDGLTITNPHDGSSGCRTEEVEVLRTADFRFKDGKIELDESGTKRFSSKGCINDAGDYKENGDGNGMCPDAGYEGTYERWCIDDNADGDCDTI